MVQNPPPSTTIPSLVQGSSAVVEELELEVGAKCPTELVDVIIEGMTYRDPSPHNALPTLQNPTHIIHIGVEDGVNIQSRLEVLHEAKQNVC
jgi:hypothetical protein